MMESPESSGLTPRNQTNLSLPARPADRRLRQRVQVGPMMLRLPGQQFLAHAGRPVHLQMITYAEHRLFLVRFTGEVLGDLVDHFDQVVSADRRTSALPSRAWRRSLSRRSCSSLKA